MHCCKIAHLDIKPDNIIYRASEQKWKYTDFGVSKEYSKSEGVYPIEGTLFYMQPYIEEAFHE